MVKYSRIKWLNPSIPVDININVLKNAFEPFNTILIFLKSYLNTKQK